MSLRKRCGTDLPVGDPFYCADSPRCDHPWHYDFRVNGRRYRASTETANKQKAKDIEARERSRILDGRHGIRRQPDITFRVFAEQYLRDHARINKRRPERDEYIIRVLNRTFGPLILHEITAHRIEQWKRDRLAGKWKAHGQTGRPNSIMPASVNRELDTLKSILSKAVEWGKLLESPARHVKRLKVENRRTRILDESEQARLLAACRGKLRALVQLALITGARVGELLALEWAHTDDGFLTFLETKNGRARRIPISPTIQGVLGTLPRVHAHVFASPQSGEAYTVNGMRHMLNRAIRRAGLTVGDVTFHTLRHTALSRMVAAGMDDYTVMEISGHSSTRMLARYTHPTESRKIAALDAAGAVVTKWSQTVLTSADRDRESAEIAEFLKEFGGRQEDRTPDLCVANAALSQLS